MAYRGERRTNPLFAVSAVGLLLFGVLVLSASIQRRIAATRVPPEAKDLWAKGYSNLLPSEVKPRTHQWVVVTKARLNAGDAVLQEFVELRSADWVIGQYPQFKLPAAKPGAEGPLVEGFYEDVAAVEGRYAALDIPPETPLALPMLMAKNPYANPLDEARRDRITMPMPEEPTLFQLLQPGDRVDVFVVANDEAVLRAMRSVRVVALNNLVTKGSGIITAKDEATLSVTQEAAQRKRAEIQAEAAKQAQQQPDQAKQDQPKQDDTKPDEAQQDDTQAAETAPDAAATTDPAEPYKPGEYGAVDTRKLPKGMYKVGRKFDGRTVTLQVSRAEAAVLAMCQNLPSVRVDFALNPRR